MEAQDKGNMGTGTNLDPMVQEVMPVDQERIVVMSCMDTHSLEVVDIHKAEERKDKDKENSQGLPLIEAL